MAEDDDGGWVGLVTAGSRLKGADVDSAQTRRDLMDYKELLKEQMESVDPNDPPGWMTSEDLTELQNMYNSLEEYGSHFDVDPAHFAAYAVNIVCDIVGLLFGALKLTVSNTRQIVSDAADSFNSARKNYDDTVYSNGIKEKVKNEKRKSKDKDLGQGKNSQSPTEYKYGRQERAARINEENRRMSHYNEQVEIRSRRAAAMRNQEERLQSNEMAMKR